MANTININPALNAEQGNVAPGIVYVDGREKTPNEKLYLVLIQGELVSNENAEYRDYEWVIGRQKLYEYLRDLILNEEDVIVDIHKTVVISESVTINDYISLYEFMKTFKDIVIDETGFDIEEYNIEGIGEIDLEE